MRYLNKIIFINSASVKYAEIELDGNVHLIGTQGVGKSTLLRAILFFYNANKSKLGIPTAKKRFDNYYFEFQNSYIIYEVVKEGVPFSVLAYKVNGKVAFRFIDSEYRKEFFIDKNRRAFENWDKTRKALGKNIHYTKIISSYDEYRKIIYGDNKGLKPEFRKYALVESKQYQNIPRTIQNVLLNSNLEAKFIKDTIINSISEDEFKIDLSNYSRSHLRDFETEINDIKIWSDKNRKGQIVIRNRADRVIENYRILNFIEREKKGFAFDLSKRVEFIKREKPYLLLTFSSEQTLLETLGQKIEKLKELHLKREQKGISEIDYFKKRIKESAEKQIEYENQNILAIIVKVAKEDSLTSEEKTITAEKTLLTSKFSEISEKYDALISQVRNQQKEFENEKIAEKNIAESNFTNKKMTLYDSFTKVIEKIETAHQDEKVKAENEFKLVLENENIIKRKKAELKYKVFFNDEINQAKNVKTELENKVSKSIVQIDTAKNEIITVHKEWNLEKREIKQNLEIKFGKQQETQQSYIDLISTLENRLKQGDSSFFGWLNDNVPQWEESVGKIVDDKLLFTTNLSPKKSENSNNIFGVELNLQAIKKTATTVEELEEKVVMLKEKLLETKHTIAEMHSIKTDRLNSLNLKFSKKVALLKDKISKSEYTLSQSEQALKENRVALEEWENRADFTKREMLEKFEINLEKLSNKKYLANSSLERIKKSINRAISLKGKERDREISSAETIKYDTIRIINNSIFKKKDSSEKRLVELKKRKSQELNNEGADTERINGIEARLSKIHNALIYIKNNRNIVAEYQKDKRELFDKILQFKTDKSSLEKKQLSMQSEQKIELEKFNHKYCEQDNKVTSIKVEIDKFETDLEEYEKFTQSDAFSTIQVVFDTEFDKKSISNKTAITLMDAINEKYYSGIKRLNDLQQSINLFTDKFSDNNVFHFKVKFNENSEYLTFASELKEFIDEDKINEFEKRVNERFAHIIHQIGSETADLISKEAEIEKIIKKINADFTHKNFVEAIKQMEMRTQKSSNPVVKLLIKIKEFSDENYFNLGESSLFSSSDRSNKNGKAVELLKQLVKELDRYKNSYLTLSESFDLQFRIVENDNDSGWVEKLSNVGSEGTDVLVKAMINILLLNVFKNSASKKFKDFKLHCMMDEIGRLHPNNVKGILRFANERNILLINGSPTSLNAIDYKYTYKLSKEQSKNDNTKYLTKITRLVKVMSKVH